MRLIDADKMAVEESEAYISAHMAKGGATMRLIDSNALNERFDKRIKWLQLDVHDQYSLGLYHGAVTDKDLIGEIPTVDAVEVVRKPVVGYEGYYEVDQFGRVFGVDRVISVDDNGRKYKKPIAGNQMKQSLKNKGYKVVSLTKDGITKMVYVHRLVAEAFIPNPDNLPMVNHKDEDKTNNFVENLEWCTNDYNINYGTARKRQAKKIRGIPHTDEHKKKISESMKAYREKEKAERGYCYNGRGKRKEGAD